ncbi:MAG: hypothetical protein R2705_24420 [Ilumatobacteraceae bacterium]
MTIRGGGVMIARRAARGAERILRRARRERTTTDGTWFGDSELLERFPAWTRGNAADVFPDPFSPLGQSLVIREGMAMGLRDGYIQLGAMDWDESTRSPFARTCSRWPWRQPNISVR